MALINPISLVPPQYKMLAYIVIIVVVLGAAAGLGAKVAHTFTKNHYVTVIAKMNEEAATMRAEKAELERKLAAEIANIKERVITKYVDRVKVVKEKEYVYRDQAITVVPDRGELSSGWVYLHDAAAAGSDAESARSADDTPSGVKANQALAVVAENYAICHANAEQLTALQEYVREVEKIVADANEVLNKKK
jgi:NAD(P)-dependent dehydrogenase (short-subunit alcohol dehydrogenase family)